MNLGRADSNLHQLKSSRPQEVGTHGRCIDLSSTPLFPCQRPATPRRQHCPAEPCCWLHHSQATGCRAELWALDRPPAYAARRRLVVRQNPRAGSSSRLSSSEAAGCRAMPWAWLRRSEAAGWADAHKGRPGPQPGEWPPGRAALKTTGPTRRNSTNLGFHQAGPRFNLEGL